MRSTGLLFIVLSFVLWLIVEFITVWHSKLSAWFSILPFALVQYLVIVLFFYLLFFRIKLAEKFVFLAMICVMYLFEFLWQNALLWNVFWFIPVSVLLISIWGFLTFIPFWLVSKSLGKHRLPVIFFCIWPVLGFVIAFLMKLF